MVEVSYETPTTFLLGKKPVCNSWLSFSWITSYGLRSPCVFLGSSVITAPELMCRAVLACPVWVACDRSKWRGPPALQGTAAGRPPPTRHTLLAGMNAHRGLEGTRYSNALSSHSPIHVKSLSILLPPATHAVTVDRPGQGPCQSLF